ncbi:MAG: hypothetical protein PHU21_03370 [Elusimicrobia bacterium]|nr:hypothetical protein [Elusimicrobiota bacterium]
MLRRASLKAKHEKKLDDLFGKDRLVCDWHEQGLAWPAEGRKRRKALAMALAKARQARARIMLVADGRQAAAAWAAVLEAGADAPQEPVAEKFIASGVAAPGPAHTALVKERLIIWRTEGSMIEPAGNQLEFIDARGRTALQPLRGDAVRQAGAIALLHDLIASNDTLAGALVGVGQLPGSFQLARPAPAPQPSETFAVPRATEPARATLPN